MPQPSVAVVGASNDRRKFGNKSVRAHAACGWKVYPVHPSAAEIEGLPAYARLTDLPGPVERVSLYLPAEIGAEVAAEIAELGPVEVYVNPGAGGRALDDAFERHGIENVKHTCSIVDLGVSPADFGD